MALVFAIMLTWVLRQNHLLKALKQGSPDIDKSWFWKIWPVRQICLPGAYSLIIWQG